MPVRIFMPLVAVAFLTAACNSVATPGNEPATLSGAATPVGGSTLTGVGAGAIKVQSSLPAPDYSMVDTASQYRLGPLDTVTVSVFQVPELSGDFQIGSDGLLPMPLIGNVKAAGRTAQDVQKEVAAKLGANYVQSPQVIVRVSGFNSQKVTVDGNVTKPGTFPVNAGNGTLLQYIAAAGGMPRTADASNVAVFRTVGNQRMVARFDVNKIRNGQMADPAIYGGDTVVVARSGIRSAWSDVLSALPAASFVASVGGL